MIVHKHLVDAALGEPYLRFLMSDLHLGSNNADHDLIIRQLRRAKEVGARVLINGDVFDAIGPKDRRYDLSTLHLTVRAEKDLARAIVDLAQEILMPFRDIIDIIGVGNHEETWVTYNHGDPVRSLIRELNREGGSIRHGSFWGYILTKFRVDGHRKTADHRLLYLHGTGGDSPVTKGTIDFNRKGRNWVYDALTFGHKHNYVCSMDQMADVTSQGKYVERRQLNLQTGSYYRNYKQLDDRSVLDQSYAARSGHPPKPLGGLFLCLRPEIDEETGELTVRQDFATDILTASKARKGRQKAA